MILLMFYTYVCPNLPVRLFLVESDGRPSNARRIILSVSVGVLAIILGLSISAIVLSSRALHERKADSKVENCYYTSKYYINTKQTTQHHATPRNTTQHHAASRSITQHHAASRSASLHSLDPFLCNLFIFKGSDNYTVPTNNPGYATVSTLIRGGTVWTGTAFLPSFALLSSFIFTPYSLLTSA